MPHADPPTRRALRLERGARASRRIARRRRVALTGALGLGAAGLAVLTAVVWGASVPHSSATDASGDRVTAPAHVTALPVPSQTAAAAPAPCDDPAVVAALDGGADADVLNAFGGPSAFRAAIAAGAAPCIDLADASRTWVVVDKLRPLHPVDFAPAQVVRPDGMQRTADVRLRPDAAAALTDLVAAAAGEGAGAIGLNSAYRSYASQTRIYGGYVASLGRAAADLQSARPGYSEHQTALAADVAACDRGCGTLEAFGGTPQADWVAANAWRFGFIVRYEDGATDVTGYTWEPWHVRYIGPELAQVYHDEGFRTLEEFFGLPGAPDYAP